MRHFQALILLILIVSFSLAQKPEGIRIFNIDDRYNKTLSYEYTVFKNEIFGIRFIRGRGTNYYWNHLNDSELKESNDIQFLYSRIYDYISDEYEKQLELAKNTSDIYNISEPSNDIPKPIINNIPEPINGGEEYYYEVFKALNEEKQPQILKFIYSDNDNNVIAYEVTITIWICDEIDKAICLNNDTMNCEYDKENKKCTPINLCDKIENISKQTCENVITLTPNLTKCIYEKKNGIEKCLLKNLCVNSLSEEECNSAITSNRTIYNCIYDEVEEICKEEKKYCHEIYNDATEEICLNAETFGFNKKCVFNKEKNSCNEINVSMDNKGRLLINFNYLLIILYLIILI